MAEQAARWQEFHRAYSGIEGKEWVQLIGATGEWLSLLTDEEAVVNALMVDVFESIFWMLPDEYRDKPWREWWSELAVGEAQTAHGVAALDDLHAYAFYGLPASSGPEDPTSIETYVTRVARWRKIADTRLPHATCPQLEETVRAAEARARLDTGSLLPEDLALLAGVSLKSVRNALTPSADVLTTQGGRIENAAGRNWLAARAGFRPSLWQDGLDESYSPPVAEGQIDDEVLFLPVTKDGRMFDPAVSRTSKGYIIGTRGSEVTVQNFLEALDWLSRMTTPSWRHPTQGGRWTISHCRHLGPQDRRGTRIGQAWEACMIALEEYLDCAPRLSQHASRRLRQRGIPVCPRAARARRLGRALPRRE